MSCCGVTIEAHRNADLRKTYAPRGRHYTFAGFSPLMQIRDGSTVLMTISLSATANGSVFSVVSDALALTLKKADVLALASGPGDRLLSYDIVLSQGGIESWFVGGDFIVLDINATTTEGEQNVTVDLDGQTVDVTIMGGNIGIGASVLLADLNSAVESAEQSADDAAASLAAVPGLATTAGAAAGATAGAAAGTSAGTTAGTAAANVVVAGKLDKSYAPDLPQAVARPAIIKARDHITVEDWDNGLRDDQTVLELAFDAAASTEGRLGLRAFDQRVIEESITIPGGVRFSGPLTAPDCPQPGFTLGSGDIGVIRLAGGALFMGSQVTFEGFRIVPDDLTLPFASRSAALAYLAQMEGLNRTAVASQSTGVTLRDLHILGFNKAFLGIVGQRTRLQRLRFDCHNGIESRDSADFQWLDACEGWPWMTANQGFENSGDPTTYDVLARNGTAYKIDGVSGGAINDWAVLRDCASYGYMVGIENAGADHTTISNHSADNIPAFAALAPGTALRNRAEATVGALVSAGSRNVRIEGGRFAAQGRSVVADTNGEAPRIEIDGVRSWAPYVSHGDLIRGDVTWRDGGGLEGGLVGSANRIRVYDTLTRADIEIRGPSNPVIEGVAVSGGNIVSNPASKLNITVTGSPKIQTVASASGIAVADHWSRVKLTGTINVGTLSITFPGHQISFQAASTMLFLDGGNMELAGSENFTFSSPRNRLVLECDGTKWMEISRSTN